MLQQTRAETAIPFFERFLSAFPTVERLAAADEEAVLSVWSGLGYYRRARLLLAGARHVVEHHRGAFPRTIEDALRVPGVGPYTAAAVVSIVYGLPHPVLDGNVERVITRLLSWSGSPRSAAARRELLSVLRSWMPEGSASDFNQAMMELGATVCLPSAPRCSECPLAPGCASRLSRDVLRYPELPPRRGSVPLELEAGIVSEKGAFLLERASGWSFLEGLWLFPLAERVAGKPGIASVLERKLEVAVRPERPLDVVKHSITYRRIVIRPRWLRAGRIDLSRHPEFRWAPLAELGRTVPVSSLCLKIAGRIREDGGITPREAIEDER